MRQSIRGYTEALIEQASGTDQLAEAASELRAIGRLIDASEDLRRALGNPGVTVPSRRGVVTDLLQDRVSETTLRLVLYEIGGDRATELRKNLDWLVVRVDAAARGLIPVGEPVLGRRAAEERLDGYSTAFLERVEDRGELGVIEDELFGFMQVVGGSDELREALSSRDVPRAARRTIVLDLLRDRATPVTSSLAAYATQVGRPRDYENLLRHLVDRVAIESDRRVAEVRAPVELDDAQRRSIAAALGSIVGRTVEIRPSVDRSVLGGFVATIGDTIVDGSTRHRLELLKERMEMPEMNITAGASPPTGESS